MIYEKRNVKYTYANVSRLVDWAHVHHEFEIIYAEQDGASALCDGVEQEIKQGELFISFPHTIHSYQMKVDRSKYMLFVFSPDDFAGFTKLLLKFRPTCPVIKCNDKIKRIMDDIKSMGGTDFYEQKLFAYVTLLLSEIIPQLELVERTPSESNNLKRLLEYCGENFTKDLNLENLSKELYMNKYHISHLFNDVLGISLRKYINTMRIKLAEQLLAQNELSVNEVAYSVGFTTQRTFNRVFIEHRGITPSEFRQKKLQKAKEKSI